MKIEKTFDLLNSEGSVVKIERIQGNWHYKFHGSRHYHLTTVKEILSVIWNDDEITDPNSGKTYRLSEYPLSMKGDDTSYYEMIIEKLLDEELKKMSKDPIYFLENYLTK
jgi:hypothetical protein